MNLKIEKEIVGYYYQRWCKKRINWELETPRKRDDGIWKVRSIKYLEEKTMYPVEYLALEKLKDKIIKLGGREPAYLISLSFVGELSIDEGIKMARNDDMGCVLYFGNGVGYYHEGELEKFPQEYILLKSGEKI